MTMNLRESAALVDLTPADVQLLTRVRPDRRQLEWQTMEFYAFIHFGINTMTDREWGLGHEDPSLFDPADLDVDVDQWMDTFSRAGMTGVILTAKHHDGFCLWPSAATGHTVASSPWRDGKGDVVRLVADSARAHGLKFGVYLSPWDRTAAGYGTGAAYDDFFVRQLEELLTQYGEVFSVWFDGANGEGRDGRRQEYDWDRYYEAIRRLQPDAVISVCGPDVRWCGNEAGHTRANEWSVVPATLRDAERIADRSQRVDDGEFSRIVRSDEEDLGSRAAIAGRFGQLVWYPAEVNTSIRPGWFYHASEDERVRSGHELFELWCDAVGGNACLLLNVPPDRRGRIAEADRGALLEVGRRIEGFAARALPAQITASSGEWSRAVRAEDVFSREWSADSWVPVRDDQPAILTLRWEAETEVSAVVVREDIRQGQRIEELAVTARVDGRDVVIARAESVGYQRILRFPPVRTDRVAVAITRSRGLPVVRAVGVIGAENA